mgnify:CR=1 FL=1
MRPLLYTLGYLTLVFPGGALLAPLAWVAVYGDIAPLSFLSEHDDFHRFITRCIMIVALIGLWPLLKMNDMASFKAIGLTLPTGNRRRVILGLSVGLGSFAFLIIIGTSASPLELNLRHPFAEWIGHVKNAGLAMILVSLIEEFLFRGVLFGTMRRSLNWRWAAVFTSIVFASVHFLDAKPKNPEIAENLRLAKQTYIKANEKLTSLKKKPGVDPDGITTTKKTATDARNNLHAAQRELINPLVGLITLPNMIRGPADDPQWAARFLNLILAGLILAGLYQNTGNLYVSMAVHGGWILGGKTAGMVTIRPNEATSLEAALWGEKEFLEGWAMTPILLAIIVWVFLYQQREHDSVPLNHDNAFIT